LRRLPFPKFFKIPLFHGFCVNANFDARVWSNDVATSGFGTNRTNGDVRASSVLGG
jgi:hypothetical protein